MLRASRFLSICFFAAIAFANVDHANAQAFYELGPFLAIGVGETETEAKANAYAEAWDIVDATAAALPFDHVFEDLVIEYQEYIGNSYFLEFHLLIHDLPNLPQGGSGSGDPP